MAFAFALAAGCGKGLGTGSQADGALSAKELFLGGAFPEGFLWGVATAGYQSEGGDTSSNWLAWEKAGKLPSLPAKAVDFWNRYPEDMDLAKGMALNSFRMSVEWSRVEPKAGTIDTHALAHYTKMIDAARDRGLEPIVTLNYFTYPAWLDGGWDNPEAPDRFGAYAKLVATQLKGKVKTWITLNVRKSYNWPVSPAQLTEACVSLWKKYKKPVFIAENGLATKDLAPRGDGWTREAALVHHLYYLREAVRQGVPIMGYMHWSLTDNYEWGDWTPRFGLYSVNHKDPALKRVPTPAVDVYRAIASTNSLPSAMVWKYMGIGTP